MAFIVEKIYMIMAIIVNIVKLLLAKIGNRYYDGRYITVNAIFNLKPRTIDLCKVFGHQQDD